MPSEVPIRNDGLLEELRRELADARDREAAANEVLRAVAATSAAVKGPVRDLQSVLGALTEAAVRLSRADKGLIRRRDGDRYVAVSGYGFSGTFREWAAENVLEARGDSIVAQAATTRATVHIPDVLAEPGWSEGDWQRLADFRSAVAVPLLSGGDVLGVLVVHRTEPAAFTDRQLQVLQTFTDQAVIAIENARLLADLTEVIEQQGTTGEILRAIANAPTSADGVLSSIAESAARVLNVSGAEIMRVDGASLTLVAKHGSSHQWPMGSQRKITREWVTGRAIVDRATVHVADLQAAADEFPEGAAYARQYGHKTTLAAPLLSEGNPIGAILIRRSEVRPFSKKQIALLETLADQAVIAIENTRLFEAEQASKRELKESLEYQTATSEVLSVISRSPTQLQPVLDTIARTSQRLCEADRSSVWRLVDGAFQVVATSDYSRAIADYMTREPVPADRSSLAGRCVLEKSTLHVHDRLNEPDLPPLPQSYATGARTLLCVPLLREGEPIGVIRLSRDKVAPFTKRQIALVETFADQAVIAIENTRLFNETQSALARQTATADILAVISQSPTDVQPVFQAIAERARELCKAEIGATSRLDGDFVYLAGVCGPSVQSEQAIQAFFPIARHLAPANIREALARRAPYQISDVHLEPDYPDVEAAERMGVRSILSVPLLHEGRAIGTIGVARGEPGLFADEIVKVLQTFARQAVIAIENTRLFEAEQASKRELQESLEYQTATSDVLGVIAASPTNIRPVLQTLVESACRMCRAYDGIILLREGDWLQVKAHHGPIPANLAKRKITRDWVNGRCVADGAQIHVQDLQAEVTEYPEGAALAQRLGARTILSTPLMKEEEAIGAIMIRRDEVRPFSDKQMRLLEIFADQAVIAIENARLFEAEQASKRELQEALERQTATSEVLHVISRSPGDLKPVFQAMLENATRICDAKFGVLQLHEGGGFRIGAIHNAPPAFAEAMARREPLMRPTPPHPFMRMVRTKEVVQIPDLVEAPAYIERDPGIALLVERASARTFLAVPMLKENEVVGVIAIYRQEVRAFTDKQVAVVVNFANQAVIAIENIRLLNELRESLRQLEIASQHKSQFVANMSHELRTPLAAILGYAELMQEGFYEAQGPKSLDALTRIRSNGKHLLGLINTVLDIAKIESGQFTLNMSEYDVQSIVETVRSATESLAQNKKLTLKTDVAKKLPIGVGDEQRLTQVLLNLVGNAIKFTDSGEVRVSATAANGTFAVSVADTGPGIPPDQLTRVFEQFHQVDSSNTKAKGGTGLGLAISKQIVEMHGGRIWVESTLGKGSVFHMELPTRAEFRKVAS